MRKMLLAVLVLLAVPASANAATVLTVNDRNDAKLESTATTCESEDAGKCTLRAAVELASKGGETTIDLPEGTYRESLSPATLVVRDGAEITIKGAGESATMIAGDKEQRVLEVESGGVLTLEGATVEGGAARSEDGFGGWGGGISVELDGSLLLRHVRLTNNFATYEGGAIALEEGGSAVVEESRIDHNEAGNLGGGIFVEISSRCLGYSARGARHASARPHDTIDGLAEGLTVSRSSIEDNTVGEGDGGGLALSPYVCQSSQPLTRPAIGLLEEIVPVTIEQSLISGNSAEVGEANFPSGYGGGVFADNYFFEDPVIDSTIADNYATEAGGGVFVAEGAEELISDTVAYNTIEPPGRIEARKASRHAARPAVTEGEEQPGANLAGSYDTDYEAAVALRNTIVTEDPSSGFNNCSGQIYSLITGHAHNLDYPSVEGEDGHDTCGMSGEEEDLVGVDPKLDSAGLQDNGGSTHTIALTSESPAIGQVPMKEDCEERGIGPALELEAGRSTPVDQRSEPRPGIAGKGCDIGAYEYQEPPKETKKEETKKEESKPAAKTEVLSVKITSPAACTSKRDIVIHIQNVKQFGVVSAVVSIDGKARRTLRGKHLRTGIDLVGLPKGTFTVSIVAKTSSGKTLHGQRVYHTCHTKLPGHLRLRL
jgi:hypothetical protein